MHCGLAVLRADADLPALPVLCGVPGVLRVADEEELAAVDLRRERDEALVLELLESCRGAEIRLPGGGSAVVVYDCALIAGSASSPSC